MTLRGVLIMSTEYLMLYLQPVDRSRSSSPMKKAKKALIMRYSHEADFHFIHEARYHTNIFPATSLEDVYNRLLYSRRMRCS